MNLHYVIKKGDMALQPCNVSFGLLEGTRCLNIRMNVQ